MCCHSACVNTERKAGNIYKHFLPWVTLMEFHNIAPIYNENSTILILGSFPSAASREGGFFYHHPQNRFWKVIAHLCHCPVPTTIAQKKQVLLHHHIALWDVIQSCAIVGSSDQSIENVIVNNIAPIIACSRIQKVFTNGTLATKLYRQHMEKKINIKAIPLPSTSSANARYSLEKLQTVWEEKIAI